MQPRRHTLLAAALALTIAGGAQACPDHSSKTAASIDARPASAHAVLAWKPRAWTPAGFDAPRAQGLRVAIDPVDGTLGMPGADELVSLSRIGDDAPVPIERAADGTLTARLDERYEEFAVAILGPGGKPAWTCVQGRRAVDLFMNRPAAPTIAPSSVWEVK